MEKLGSIPNWKTLVKRGVRKRCPQCGEGRVFSGWLKMHERCERCGLKYLANEGDLWAYLILIDRALFLFPLVVMIYFRINNPESPWTWVISGALLFLFLYTLPHRNGISLGIDYRIRRKAGDLVDTETKTDEPFDPWR